ncbi:MAG: class II aldolase/adducin family protein [Paracoccaceae bacterium]
MTRPEAPTEDSEALRQAIIDACLWMNESGLNQGTSGNISVRVAGGMLITPSGVPYAGMRPWMIRRLPLDAPPPPAEDGLKPSSEWHFHQALLRARPDMRAVVHAHPAHATAVSALRRPIPACHYMVAAFGGNEVPLAEYALFGSAELSGNIVTAMAGRHGCLMASHGAVVLGETLERALWRMEELEGLARVYLLATASGSPHILGEAEMAQVHRAFADYGARTASKRG